MNELNVDYLGGVRFNAETRAHTVTIDLPKEKGGEDAGMTPPEIFMASLGSCIGVYVVKYCGNAKLNCDGLKIQLGWAISDDKTKIDNIYVTLMLPHADIGNRKDALLAVAQRCLIHNTILGHPVIRITLNP